MFWENDERENAKKREGKRFHKLPQKSLTFKRIIFVLWKWKESQKVNKSPFELQEDLHDSVIFKKMHKGVALLALLSTALAIICLALIVALANKNQNGQVDQGGADQQPTIQVKSDEKFSVKNERFEICGNFCGIAVVGRRWRRIVFGGTGTIRARARIRPDSTLGVKRKRSNHLSLALIECLQVRLPADLIPVHYDLYLHPNLEDGSFNGIK